MDFSKYPALNLSKIDLNNIEWPKFRIPKIGWPRISKLRIGNVVARLPIVQGGMGVGISLSGLASAVANEGGIGVIAANSIGMLNPDYFAKNSDANAIALRREIRKTKAKTAGIFGVNIMVAVNDFQALLRVAIEEKVDLVFLGAGLPIKGIPVEDLRSAGVKVVPIVSSARAASLIFRSWVKRYADIPDAVVVEGPKAGGHLGFKENQIDNPNFALENILPEVVAEIKKYEDEWHRVIPVIAAGGIYTGADMHKLFKLGARAIQLGTRFVATDECDANIRFKESYISCGKDDIKIIKTPVGMPGRAIGNRFLTDVASGKRQSRKCAWRCLKSCDIKTAPYCLSLALNNARKGILDKGFAFAGSNAYRVDKIVSVKELVKELKEQYLCARENSISSLRGEYEKTLERLSSFKEAYLIGLKVGLNSLRDEYERGMERGGAFREELLTKMDQMTSLKNEYRNALEKAYLLKQELMTFFSVGSPANLAA